MGAPTSLPKEHRLSLASRLPGGRPLLLLTALVTLAVAAGARPASAQTTPPVRIMPLGDSITHGYNVSGGYRVALEDALAAGGFAVDFVGSRSDGPRDLADRDHEGHPGWRVDQISARADEWVRTSRPEVVLLMIGTNDVLQDADVAGAPQRLSGLIDRIAAAAPSARILVASLTPLGRADREQRARSFNAAVPGIVGEKAARGLRVSFVDMHAALSSSSDLADGVHPNPSGYARMASVWFAGLEPVLAGPAQTPVAPPVPGSVPVPAPATVAPQSAPVPERSEAPARRLVRVSSARLRVESRGRIRVRVACREGGPATCSGVLRLRVAGAQRGDRDHLATRRFRVSSDRSASVRLRLDRRERRLVRRRTSTRVSIETVIRLDGRRYATRTSARIAGR